MVPKAPRLPRAAGSESSVGGRGGCCRRRVRPGRSGRSYRKSATTASVGRRRWWRGQLRGEAPGQLGECGFSPWSRPLRCSGAENAPGGGRVQGVATGSGRDGGTAPPHTTRGLQNRQETPPISGGATNPPASLAESARDSTMETSRVPYACSREAHPSRNGRRPETGEARPPKVSPTYQCPLIVSPPLPLPSPDQRRRSCCRLGGEVSKRASKRSATNGD
jgi:hypothetical protein